VKITAAITTCNRLEQLKKAIKSVENQSFAPCELIIIDDNSSDGTKEYCESLSLNFAFIYLRNAENRGACFSRNRAIKKANGEYIAFLDDDDEWESEKLLKQNEFAEKGFDLIYTAAVMQNNSKIFFHKPFPIYFGNFAGITSTMTINLQILQKIGGFDTNLPALQDYDLLISLVKKKAKIKGINEPLVKYQPSDNGNISGSAKKFFLASKIILSKTGFFVKPLQFIGLARIFAQKIVKSKEFRREVLLRLCGK